MKVSREASAETRRRIVGTAGRLFRERGYAGVGVAEIMQQAGLTHGGFYGHFASKDDLAAEASVEALESKAGIWNIGAAEPPGVALERFVTGYLSEAHRDDAGNGCALAALGAEAARAPLPVRAAFGEAVRSRLERLIAMLPGRNRAAQRRKAIVTLAGVVGALVLARAVADPALSGEILQTAKETFRN